MLWLICLWGQRARVRRKGHCSALGLFVSLPCHMRWLPLINVCAVGGEWEGASLASG